MSVKTAILLCVSNFLPFLESEVMKYRIRVTSQCRMDAPCTALSILHVLESTRAILIHSPVTSREAEANQHLSVQVTIS